MDSWPNCSRSLSNRRGEPEKEKGPVNLFPGERIAGEGKAGGSLENESCARDGEVMRV